MRARLRILALAAALVVGRSASASPCGDADALATVRALCAAVDTGSAADVRARVRLPLRLRTIVSENAGDPIRRRRTLRSVAAVRRARVCADVQLDAATVADGTVTAPIGQFDAVFTTAARRGRCVVTAIVR